MTCSTFKVSAITRERLAAMREDARICNQRLNRVLRPGSSQQTKTRAELETEAVLRGAKGKPFTRFDVMFWTDRCEWGAGSLIRRMEARGFVARDGYRGRAHLYRVIGISGAAE